MATAFIVAPSKLIKVFARLLWRGLVGLGPLVLRAAALAFGLLSNPIGWAVLLAGAAAGLVWYFWDDLVAAWDQLSGKVDELASRFGEWFENASWSEIFIRTAFPLTNFFWDELNRGWDTLSTKAGDLATRFGEWFKNASWAEIMVRTALPLTNFFWEDLKSAWEGMSDRVSDLFGQMRDWILDIDWAGIGTSIMQSIWDGMKAIGDQIKTWFLSIIPDWAKRFFDEGPGTELGAQENDGSAATVMPSSVPSQSEPLSRTNAASDYALELQRQEWERIQSNLNGNLAKQGSAVSGTAAMNDNRQDNRSFTDTTTVTVNQTVTQAVDAPRQAANATGNAVAKGVAKKRSQIHSGPAF